MLFFHLFIYIFIYLFIYLCFSLKQLAYTKNAYIGSSLVCLIEQTESGTNDVLTNFSHCKIKCFPQ